MPKWSHLIGLYTYILIDLYAPACTFNVLNFNYSLYTCMHI